MGYNVKICEKKVERIQKEILKQKKLIVDLNVKIRKLKKELKPRKLKGGTSNSGEERNKLYETAMRIYRDNYLGWPIFNQLEILNDLNLDEPLILSYLHNKNKDKILDDKQYIYTILQEVKLEIRKTHNSYDKDNFIHMMNFVNHSIKKEKNKLISLYLFEYYIQHNMNSRLEMFNTIFEKIKNEQVSMVPFIRYIITVTDCYIIEDYELGNIIIQAATKHGKYGFIDEMIKHKRYFDITECMKSIAGIDTIKANIIKNTLVNKLSSMLAEHSLYDSKYVMIIEDIAKFRNSLQDEFDDCIDILLLNKTLKFKNNEFSIFKKSNKEFLIEQLKIAAEEDYINLYKSNRFSQIFDRFRDIDNGTIITLINFMASKGFLDILKNITHKYTVSYKILHNLCHNAAGGGHLEVLQWARANGCPWNKKTCSAAARGGHLDVLQWARANKCPWDADTCVAAAEGNHLSVLQWAINNGCPLNEDTCTVAAEEGHLDVMEWTYVNDIICEMSIFYAAAKGGHLAVLQWAHDKGIAFDKGEDVCSIAAYKGHLEVLQWLRKNGCLWNETTCSEAANNGHLNVLQWARANGCPWDEYTCSGAANNGHLNVLQWARANGCPWDIHNIIKKIHLDNFIILRWIFEYNHIKDSNFEKMNINGKGRLYPYVVKWYIDNNVIDDISVSDILENKTYNIDTQLRVKNLMAKKSLIAP